MGSDMKVSKIERDLVDDKGQIIGKIGMIGGKTRLDKRQQRKLKREIIKAETRVSKKIIDRMIELKGDQTIGDIRLGNVTKKEQLIFDEVMGLIGTDVEPTNPRESRQGMIPLDPRTNMKQGTVVDPN